MSRRMTEDAFLEDRIGHSVAIYLVTGIKLLGKLDDHDCEVVFLRPHGLRAAETQMISKHALSTIQIVGKESLRAIGLKITEKP